MKEVKLNIPEYDGNSLKLIWENNYKIKVEIDDESCIIKANKEGLISLAKQLLTLAQVSNSNHYHLDEYGALEDGSNELVICKDDEL